MTSPGFTAIAAAWVAAWLVLLLFAAAAVIQASRSRKEMRRKIGELSSRGEQLRLVSGLFAALSQERRRHGVAQAAVQFFVQEMGAGRAAYWRPNGDGEPQSPSVSLPESGAGAEPLPQAQRIILARAAGRGTAPLIVGHDAADQRPRALTAEETPRGAFTLYLPLAGTQGEGVLEVYSGDAEWRPDVWEVLPLLGATLADALGRAGRHEELREQADVDSLTGVYNHRYTQVYLERLTSGGAARGSGPEAQTVGSPAGPPSGGFVLLLLDVDHFTEFNECHGHSEGDRVLRLLADQLRLMVDRVGVVGRLGSDEFAVILPEHSRDDACAFAQAFEDWLDNSPLKAPASRAVLIGVSWGYATFPQDGATRRELLTAAEARLARRRRSGGRSAFDGDAVASAAS